MPAARLPFTGLDQIPVAVREVDPGDMVAIEAAENFARKNFTLSEAVAIKRALQPNLPKFGRSSPAREQVASYAGFSHETLRKAEAVVAAAEREPERYAKLVANMNRLGRVDGIFQQLMNFQQAERIRAAPPPLPFGKYRVIVVDPPWPMERIVRDIDLEDSAALDYPTMTETELIAFGDRVATVAADDCHSFLWTTQRFLPMGLRLLDAWGFHYVLTMVWHKNGGFQPFGLPQFNCEFVLYARKGAPTFVDTKAFDCCFLALRQGHSVKPNEFYETISRVTDGPRLDMFARKQRPGWVTWGDEVLRQAAE